MSNAPKPERKEISLDPEDWSELKAAGHKMIDDVFEYLETMRERPVFTPVPYEAYESFSAPLPQEPQDIGTVYQDFKSHIFPYPFNSIHPHFWGWVNGGGDAVGMLAELLKASMNSQVVGYPDATPKVEHQVLDWIKGILEYPADSSGVLVSGASKAVLIGLTVARNSKAGSDVKQQGVYGLEPLTIYGSERTHFCVQRAAEVLGLGSRAMRKIPCDRNFRVQLQELRETIQNDIAAGLKPFCIVGNAGTTATGAIDDLDALADIAQEFDLWYHVDGAIGAMANISPRVKPLLKGMNRADSISLDLHKWMHIPYEAGCAFVRSTEKHINSFSWKASYISEGSKKSAPTINFMESGIQLSREFRALKIWMAFKVHGIDKYRQLIEQNLDQAQYLAKLVHDRIELVLAAPVHLTMVCFRFRHGSLTQDELNALNFNIIKRLQMSGKAVISEEDINGLTCMRVCAINHRSKLSDFDQLIEDIVEAGNEIMKFFE